MPNYKETVIAGQSWWRAHRLEIVNQYNRPAKLTIYEQKLVESAEGVIAGPTGAGPITVTFDAANPLHLAAYQALNAVYEEARAIRDGSAP